MLYAESSEDCGHITFLTETEAGTIAGDLDAKELPCQADVHDIVFLREFRFDFDHGCGSSLQEHHADIVDIQQYQNAIAAEIEVGIG